MSRPDSVPPHPLFDRHPATPNTPWRGRVLKFPTPPPPPPLCICCDLPATRLLGDWEVCQEHYNSLAEPWPEELEEVW